MANFAGTCDQVTIKFIHSKCAKLYVNWRTTTSSFLMLLAKPTTRWSSFYMETSLESLP